MFLFESLQIVLSHRMSVWWWCWRSWGGGDAANFSENGCGIEMQMWKTIISFIYSQKNHLLLPLARIVSNVPAVHPHGWASTHICLINTYSVLKLVHNICSVRNCLQKRSSWYIHADANNKRSIVFNPNWFKHPIYTSPIVLHLRPFMFQQCVWSLLIIFFHINVYSHLLSLGRCWIDCRVPHSFVTSTTILSLLLLVFGNHAHSHILWLVFENGLALSLSYHWLDYYAVAYPPKKSRLNSYDLCTQTPFCFTSKLVLIAVWLKQIPFYV